MSDLIGSICLSRRIRKHAVWQRPEYGWAFVDLLLLANNRPGETMVNGERIPLQRGQLAWALRSLEREWDKSGEWVRAFLDFCRDNGMVRVDSNRRRTIITITNYEVYNPVTVTETGTEPETDTATITGTVTEQKVEGRKEKWKGEAPPAENNEIPDDQTIREFCETWPGDQARGIPAGIPEVWWSGWVANRLNNARSWPADWQRVIVLAFRSDFINRHPKALGNLEAVGSTGKKNGGEKPATTPAMRRFELSKQLEAVKARLAAAYETNLELDPADLALEKQLESQLAEV